MLERIQHVRQLYVNEISATLTLDNELFLELSECKKVNSENMKVVEMLAAKKKEHHSVAQLRDKVRMLPTRLILPYISLTFIIAASKLVSHDSTAN